MVARELLPFFERADRPTMTKKGASLRPLFVTGIHMEA